MNKYWRLYKSFIRTGFVADLEFRFNFSIKIISDIIWYGMQIMAFEILYQHTTIIGTWNLDQTRVFLGILFMADALYMIIFSDNLERMIDGVRKGDLDMILSKPVNSQFFVSLRKVDTSMIFGFWISASYFIWALVNFPNLEPLRLLWIIILIPCGLISFYSFRFMVATFSVIFTKADYLQFLWHQLYRLGMRPDQIYRPWLRLFILSLLPMGLIASVPARFIVEPPSLSLFLWTLCWSLFVLWLSGKFWSYALKFYASASS
jgi:ABC-2 type transport system permease protein